MTKRILTVLLFVGAGLGACAGAASHDYFGWIKYPRERRPEVGLDRVEQEGGAGAEGFNRRVVHWWPKQGVDIVEVPEGVPLRTWTIRTPEREPLVEAGYYAKWWPADLRGRQQFQAHLIGFRGIGSLGGNPFSDEALIRAQGPGLCPAVVLRLEDGRKRVFTRGSFNDEDQAYILDLYEKEMARIHAALEPPPELIPPEIEARWPVGEMHKPGTCREESERFVISSGAEELDDGTPGAWINPRREEDAATYRRNTFRIFEDYWAYNEYAGHLMPFWERPVRYKYSVVYGSTKANGLEEFGRGNGGGYGGCGTACWEGLYHEWGHGISHDPMVLLGGGETLCDSLQPMADPSLVRKVAFQIARPYKNLFWGQYPGGFGYTMMSDDSNWGHAAVASFTSLMADIENTPMHVIARLGQERGIWEDGIKGLGDFMGQIGARMAEYDYELEGMLREAYPAPNRTALVALDRAQGLYRSPVAEAPEPFGINLVPLSVEPCTRRITVDFRGLHDPDTYGDWRACLVAVGADQRPRYSPLWNQGEMSIEIREDDVRHWLTVTATPYALAPGRVDGGNKINHIYQGGFTYKYPYEVKLTGCRPASPHAPIGANQNMNLVGPTLISRADAHLENCGLGDWPHPSDTPAYAEMRRTLEALVELAPVMRERLTLEGLFNDSRYCPVAGSKDSHLRSLASAVFLEWRASWLLENAEGARHPNGGGWVARSAQVAPTAYVGPDCMVLDGARVLDHAIIEDYAIVSGPGVLVRDHARVSGKAVVCGDVTLTDYARVSRTLFNRVSKFERESLDGGPEGYRFRMTTGIPVRRDGPEERKEVFKDAGFTLQANYAFDRPETVLLEDWYQERSLGAFAFGAHSTDLVFYDGVLRGQPGFEIDGDTRAFTFNGTDQYAEADGAMADLGTITVEVRIRPVTGRAQTVFDFGSSTADRLMLNLTAAGIPELVLARRGEVVRLSGTAPLPAGQWSTCRVEIDGTRARLWVDGQPAAERATTFRAAQAFPAGVEKRNFIAATREITDLFEGAIDYVRVYFAVHDDFAQVPEPPMVSSRRIDPDFLERFNRHFAGYDALASRYRDDIRSNEIYQFYEQWNRRVDERLAELGHSDEVAALEAELQAWEAALELRRAELAAEFDRQPEVMEKRARADALERQRQERFAALRTAHPEWVALQSREEAARGEREAMERAARAGLEEEMAAVMAARRELDGRRHAFLQEVANADATLSENRGEHETVIQALRALDGQPDAENDRDALRQRERQLNDAHWRRRDALIRNDPDWRHLEQAWHANHQEERRLIVETAGADPGYAEAEGRERVARERKHTVERDIWRDAELLAMENERNSYHTHHQREAFVTRGTVEMRVRNAQRQAEIKALRDRTALANHEDEYRALKSLEAGRGQYRWAVEDRLRGQLLPMMPESPQQLREAAPFQFQPWHTRVEWDGRIRWEKPGGEMPPIMQRWLERMRAPGVSADHSGASS